MRVAWWILSTFADGRNIFCGWCCKKAWIIPSGASLFADAGADCGRWGGSGFLFCRYNHFQKKDLRVKPIGIGLNEVVAGSTVDPEIVADDVTLGPTNTAKYVYLRYWDRYLVGGLESRVWHLGAREAKAPAIPTVMEVSFLRRHPTSSVSSGHQDR